MNGTLKDKQASCQKAFTLIELLVVICIIGILGSALTVSVQSGYKQARQANCKSNLRQFGVALMIYRGEHNNQVPNWISNLYPDYVDDRGMYVCRADENGGQSRPRPKKLVELIRDSNAVDGSAFWDNEKGTDSTRNDVIKCCSYLYEFSHATPGGSWATAQGSGFKTMGEYKMSQMQYGDSSSKVNGVYLPYSASRIPIIRCYHHWHDQKIYGYNDAAAKTSGRATRQHITLNVAYAGNVFVGPLYWEGTIYPGERTSNE